MRMNTARPKRRPPVVIPEQIAAHRCSALGEKQRNARQAVRILREHPLEVMHGVMMRIPRETAALGVVEVATVKVYQTVRNDQSLVLMPRLPLFRDEN